MKIENNSQLELFTHIKHGGVDQKGGSFFTAMRSYEKNIVLIICFIVTAIIAFSFGVEKGKSSFLKIEPLVKTDAPVMQPSTGQQNNAETKTPVTSSPLQRYAIQVASYKNVKYAQQEAGVLKKKGIVATVTAKGRYYVLYAGNFTTREEARFLLSEINKQKRYAGARIGRL